MTFPLKKPNTLTQPFGRKGDFYTSLGLLGHNGADFGVPVGTPVYAPFAGVIHKTIEESVGSSGTRGLGITLRASEKDYQDRYLAFVNWHLSEFKVEEGKVVNEGDLIALSGNTGQSSGPHDHIGSKYYKKNFWGNFYTINVDNGYGGFFDPMSLFMDYIINSAGTQYLLFTPYKMAFSIGDVEELNKIKAAGLGGFPESREVPFGYAEYPLVSQLRIKDLFNIK